MCKKKNMYMIYDGNTFEAKFDPFCVGVRDKI